MSSFDFLKGKSIKDVFPNILRRDLLTVSASTPTGEVLKTFQSQCILSMPVMSAENQIVGVADVSKLVLFAVGLHPTLRRNGFEEAPNVGNLSHFLGQTDPALILGEKFVNMPIGEVVKGVDGFHQGIPTFFQVDLETPIERLLEMFYMGVHRVIVFDKEKPRSLISQSDLLYFLASSRSFLEPKLRASTVHDLKLTKNKPPVHSYQDTDLVLHVLHGLVAHQVSSVPILDGKKLVATFSASSIRGLNKFNFGELSKLTVRQYLRKQADQSDDMFIRIFARRSLEPVTVTEDDTFWDVVSKMSHERLHRVFVVDKDHHLQQVLSLGDLFQIFLPWGAPRKFD